MLENFPLLSFVIFLPLVGVLGVLACGASNTQRKVENIRNVALLTSVATFLVSLLLWARFDATQAGFQFVERADWFPTYGIAYQVGLDGISLFFVLLSTLLTPICILASWETIQTRVREYMIAFLTLEVFMVGMFSALDTVLFYVFFEAVLVPMFLIIGVWGGQQRIYAAFKFFLYTLAGSVLMLLALLAVYRYTGTTALPTLLASAAIPPQAQVWMWLAFFVAFAVKVPMVPFHTWLPDAHVQAPTAGSVILAGVLLKMGGYGFLRFNLPLLPLATEQLAPLVFVLSAIAVVYTSLVALAQTDMKKLIAYSSIAHMGFVTVGIFTLQQQGIQGAILQMLSHGIVSGALFLCVGVVYDRLHTREIAAYGGLAPRMPQYAVLFMLFTLASVGLPGTSGFVGEFLVILGAWQVAPWVAMLTATGMILGAAYALWLYRRVMLGVIHNPQLVKMTDLTPRERLAFAPLAILTLWMGIYPAPFLKPMEPAVAQLIARYETALADARNGGAAAVADADVLAVPPSLPASDVKASLSQAGAAMKGGSAPDALPVSLHLTAGAAHD
jgi:NADH-quinone oxidoreductase subunit M